MGCDEGRKINYLGAAIVDCLTTGAETSEIKRMLWLIDVVRVGMATVLAAKLTESGVQTVPAVPVGKTGKLPPTKV